MYGATRCLVDRGKSSHLLLAIHPRSCRATQALARLEDCLLQSASLHLAADMVDAAKDGRQPLYSLYPIRRVFVRRNSQSTWQRTLYPVVAVVNMAGWADHDTWWNVDFGSRASGAAWRYFEAGTPRGLTFPSSKTFFMSGSTQAGPLCQKP